MNRWKKIVTAVVVLAAAVVAAGIAIVASLDFNEYRGLIAERVKAATGRELTIRGDLELVLSLNPAVGAEGVHFANASWGSRPQMMTLDRLAAEVELLPLLTGDVRVKRLVMEGLDLLLETDAKGRGNWVLGGAEKEPATAAPTAGGGPARLPVVHAVRIKDIRVSYRDGETGRTRTLNLASLSVRADGLDAPMTIALAGALDGEAVKASGRVGPLRTLLEGDAPYAVDLTGAALGAAVAIKGTIAQPREARGLDLRVAAEGQELRDALSAVQDQLPPLKDKTLPAIGPYRFAAAVKGGPDALSLSGIDAAVGARERLSVALKGEIADALAGRGLNVRVDLEGRDVAPLARVAGVEIPAIPPFKAAATVSDGKGGYRIDGLDGRVGRSDLKGRVSVRLDGVARPAIDARLDSELIDLDELLPQGSEAKGGGDRVFPADPLPTGALKALDAKLRLTAGRVIAGGIAANDVDVTLALGAGRLDINPFRAVVGGGRIRGGIVLDGSRPTPGLSVNLDAKQVDYGVVLAQRKLTDIASGKVDAAINLKGNGKSVRAIMAGLDGRARIVSEGGKVESGLLNVLSGDIASALPFVDSKGDKDIRCGVVELDIRDGRAAAKTLVFETGGLSMIGSGGINLADETIDLKIDPRAKKLSVLKLTLVPVNIGGTLADPTARPDVGAAAVGTVTGAVKTAKDIAKGGVKTITGLVGLGKDKEASARDLDDTDYCKLALAGRPLVRSKPAPAPAPAKQAPSPAPAPAEKPAGSTTEKIDKKLDEIGKGLGGALKGLFGK